MNNLTNEERARIFAMYMPCKGMDFYYTKGDIIYIKDIDMDGYTTIPDCTNYPQLVYTEDVKLLLTPLSKITDEHAIEVANILDADMWSVSNRTETSLQLVGTGANFFMIEYSTNKRFDFYIVSKNEKDLFYLPTGHRSDTNLIITDRLRELGYALPYKGKSLFELGIALDVTTLKK